MRNLLRWWRRTRPDGYVVSGYVDDSAYVARRASWTPDDKFSDVEIAVAVATQWWRKQGDDATVEVIRMAGSTGDVVCVVDRRGVQRI